MTGIRKVEKGTKMQLPRRDTELEPQWLLVAAARCGSVQRSVKEDAGDGMQHGIRTIVRETGEETTRRAARSDGAGLRCAAHVRMAFPG